MKDSKAPERAEILSALRCCGNTDTKRPDCEHCPLMGPMCVKRMLEGAAALLEQAVEPPNNPLTLEELREVTQAKLLQDGTILYQRPTPVWLDGLGTSHDWAVITMVESLCVSFKTLESDDEWSLRLENYGKTWLAYRYKPDGGGE